MPHRIIAALLLSTALSGAAAAGEVAEAGATAERLVSEGRHREAWEILERAQDGIWATAPLEFRRLLFVAAEPQGFGVFEPRSSNLFKAGDVLLVYGEPFGFGYGRDEGLAKIEFEVKLSVVSGAGAEVIAPRSGRLDLKSRHQNKEFMLHFAYHPQGLKPGDYQLVAEFRDIASGKSASQRMPFRIE